MKTIAMATAAAILSAGLLAGPANAAGCLKGAAIGGVAGHFAGHHGLIGAGAGCLIGRHQADKQARQQMMNGPSSNTENQRPD